jgi:hypothetical protein
VVDQDFLAAIVGDTTRVLGFELKPFSLGDLLILKRLGSPFIAGGRVPTYPELQEAVLVCANDFDASQRLLRANTTRFMVRWWHRRLSLCGLRRIDTALASAMLLHHIEKAMSNRPILKPKADSSGEDLNSPWELTLLSFLMEKLHQSFDVAINQPLALSRWLYGSAMERTGAAILSSESEENEYQNIADKMQAMIDKAFKEGKIGVDCVGLERK